MAIMELVRINHAFLLALAVLVGAIIGAEANPDIVFSVFAPQESIDAWLGLIGSGMLSVMLIETAAFAINDYWDIKADRKNGRKDRPLARGDIHPRVAPIIAAFGFLAGAYFAYTINPTVFLVAILFSVLSLFYSYDLKNRSLIGNMSIALSMAVPFAFGNLIMYDAIAPSVWLIAAMVFLMGLGREIFKSIQDMKGDRAAGRMTLPIEIGEKPAAKFASILMAAAVLLSFYPLFYIDAYYGDIYYFSFILITDILLIGSVDDALRLRRWGEVRKRTLQAQATGLFAFLLGILF